MIEQFTNLKSDIPSNQALALKINEVICALEAAESPATDRQQQQAIIKCVKCGIVLPPLDPSEGKPCPTGYLCRACAGI